jgi:enamine deaminase RidA (YjgF/YER057c/UK114 family)
MTNVVEHLNPEGLIKNPAFSQAVAVTGPHKVIYVGGQNAVDAQTRQIVGPSDMRAQAEQVFRNLRTALEAGGAGLEHIVKWNIYLVQGQDARAAFEVSQREWGDRPNPPAISVMFVAGLANPDFLIEIDAIAVVPPPPLRPTISVAAIGP